MLIDDVRRLSASAHGRRAIQRLLVPFDLYSGRDHAGRKSRSQMVAQRHRCARLGCHHVLALPLGSVAEMVSTLRTSGDGGSAAVGVRFRRWRPSVYGSSHGTTRGHSVHHVVGVLGMEARFDVSESVV